MIVLSLGIGHLTYSDSTGMSRDDITRTAEELLITHGESAYERATQEVSSLIAEGAFTEAGSWQLVKEHILRRQEASRYLEALDKQVMLSE